jgi:NADH-quinone oxidoreductase subunit L
MGGLGKKMPVTRTTFIIGSLALAGIPIFAGFFSKDEILFETFTSGILGNWGIALWVVGAAAAFMTAFYVIRAVAMTFYGKPRDKHVHEHAKESPGIMTVPLMILAGLSVVGGFLGIPIWKHLNAMHNWLGPVVGAHGDAHGDAAGSGAEAAHAPLGLELGLMAASVALAALGIWLAIGIYIKNPKRAEEIGARFRGPYRMLLNKYWVDEIYNAVVVRPLVAFSRFCWRILDVEIVDGLVNGTGKLMRSIGSALRPIQTGYTSSYATAILVGAIALMGYVLLGGPR